ncbi:helix-turn-helix domain-containing protein [Coprococcus sp. AF19-8AC]|uniref:helix-turn-helix domain-containing protein n=1 Tax=Coprococcus sp. AF19-8AC TaxID=2293090 RepID=UPI001FA94BBD|nr:helix-turn-helix transcriptional regulator [Coprococcus sp. AF19-8AC]
MTQNNFPMIDLCATGKRIKEVREQKGITVKALQAFLGFNEPVSIYKWQRGECLPTFDNMYAMACLFGVGIDDLLVGNRQEVVFVCAPWARSNGCHLSLGTEVAGTSVPIKCLINVGSMLQIYLYVSINLS